MPAPQRRVFLSREGPVSIRVFFKLGITYVVVVVWLGQQKRRPVGPPRPVSHAISVELPHEPPSEAETIEIALDARMQTGAPGQRPQRLTWIDLREVTHTRTGP
jgi:hypothetical protein